MTVQETKTFAELRRIGACSARPSNLSENMYTPRLSDTPGEIILHDGQVSIWGADDELAGALSDLPVGASYEAVTDALAAFPNNA